MAPLRDDEARISEFSGNSCTSQGSARREGPSLTLIPEGERTIDHRLQFILVGKGARVLAVRLVESEMSESFRPRSSTRPTTAQSPISSQPLEGTRSEKSANRSKRRPSICSGGFPANEEDEHLVVFCPINNCGNSLAKVRLCIVEGFSQSMPSLVDESTARDACIALLHWRAPEEDGACAPSSFCGVSCVRDTLDEFSMRVAEMTHSMAFLPLCFLLSINETREETQRLAEVVSSKMLKDGRKMQIVEVEDASDSCMLDTIQDLVAVVVRERGRALNLKAPNSNGATSGKARCCTVS